MPEPRYGSVDAFSDTGAPLRYVAPPQPAQPFDVDGTLQRWLQQVRRERGNMHTMLHRMASEVPEMTAVYMQMRTLAYHIRGEAMTAINHDFNMPHAGDPYQPNVYYSNRRLLYKVCERHGIAVADMGPIEKLAAMGYGDGQSAVYAYLQTFETEQPPVLVVDKDPYGIGIYHARDDAKSINVWTWYGACCLAKFLYDESLYRGSGAIVETIAPFDPRRHAAFWPLAHCFAKALLHMDDLCPSQWLCGCNRIEAVMKHRRPEQHPWATGELPGDVVRQMAVEQGYQEGHREGYGQAAPPSRGMTPPRGMSGELLQQWRRDTGNDGRGGK